MSNTSKYVLNSFAWGGAARLLDAAIKFVSIPLLLKYFGKEDFGIITLAISLNAYLQILDLGVNTGSIKYFSEWIAAKKFNLLNRVARTSLTFYGSIGIINGLILVCVAFLGIHWFNLTNEQGIIFQKMLVILALVAVVNWGSFVFNQLLIANENIAYVQKVNIFKSLLGLTVIFLTIFLKWGIVTYFTLFIIVNSLIVLPNYFKSKQSGLIKSILPYNDWVNFLPIFKYSLAIIAIGIFSMTATKMRPIVLSVFSGKSVGIVSDYRIMETIEIFIVSIGGMFISIFLPKTSKLLLENNHQKVIDFAVKSTIYTSIISSILCIPFMLNSKEIIMLYVGQNYLYLYKWLMFWSFTILIYLHNSPVASLVLATGKTKMLVYSSAIACVISLIINALLANKLGVGSAVLGYFIYVTIQMLFYYFYFNNSVLHLKSFQIFKSFIIPTLMSLITAFATFILNIQTGSLIIQILVKSGIWIVLFTGLLLITKTVKFKDVREVLIKKKYFR